MTTPRNGTSSTVDGGIDQLKESVKGFVDNAEERAQAIKTRAIEVKDEAMSRGTEILDRTTDFIKTNPLKAVGIAFGIGYVGMRLFR